MSFLSPLTHLFFPHVCAGCGSDVLDADNTICVECVQHLPFTNYHKIADNPLERRFWGRLPLHAAASTFYFTKQSALQNMMHAFKYKGKKDIGYYLGSQMANQVKDSDRFSDIDALVPLPLFASREKQRGYNQATVLCKAISEQLQIPIAANAVERLAATATQTHKSRSERWDNMSGKFKLVNEDVVKNKHVLLIDDVITTGATLEACGRELLQAIGSKLSILTLAYAMAE